MGGLRADLEPATAVGGELLDAPDADEADDVVEVGAQHRLLRLRRAEEDGLADPPRGPPRRVVALPEGRPTGRLARGRLGRLTERGEIPRDSLRLGDQALEAARHALLRHRRAEDVLEPRLAARRVEVARAGRGVERDALRDPRRGESIERHAQAAGIP
jgi:hypothetical protein